MPGVSAAAHGNMHVSARSLTNATICRPSGKIGRFEKNHLALAAKRTGIMTARQQVLILYLANPALDARVVSWSMYDGTGRTEHMPGDTDTPPYSTGLAALRDGWRLIQISGLAPPAPGREFTVSYQRYECVFEKWCELDTEGS
jgi:hypothetical protein